MSVTGIFVNTLKLMFFISFIMMFHDPSLSINRAQHEDEIGRRNGSRNGTTPSPPKVSALPVAQEDNHA